MFQITTTDGTTFDVVFVGTTSGRVLKLVNAASGTSRDAVSSVVIEELAVFPHNTVIKELRLMSHRQRPGGNRGPAGTSGRQRSLGRLAVLSDREVRSIAVSQDKISCRLYFCATFACFF